MTRFAEWVSDVLGRPVTFVMAVGGILLWTAAGPYFHYSSGWQLVINTGTTILTFLMLFPLQSSQNRQSKAVHVKLDELILKLDGPRDAVAGIEKSDAL